jgi:hypothetical protein
LLLLGTALALSVVAITIRSPALLLGAALVLFSGVHDRCPIWQAVAPRLAGLVRRAAPQADLTSEPGARR